MKLALEFWVASLSLEGDCCCLLQKLCEALEPGIYRDMPCHDLVDPWRAKFPCRALMIRAVPNISVPCSHDPCPDLVVPCRAAQEGFKRCGAFFVEKKKLLRQRTHKLGASRNMGPFFWRKKYGAFFFWRKKAPAATYPQVGGFQKYG